MVIAAGYPREIDAFLAANSGLPSRFTTRVEFPHYGIDDLVEILRRMAASERCTLAPGVPERAAAWLEAARRLSPSEFGNARTVRGLLELMEARMATRYDPADAGQSVPTEFLPEDVPDPPS